MKSSQASRPTNLRRVTPWHLLTKEQQEAAYAPYEIYVPLDEFIKIRSQWFERDEVQE